MPDALSLLPRRRVGEAEVDAEVDAGLDHFIGDVGEALVGAGPLGGRQRRHVARDCDHNVIAAENQVKRARDVRRVAFLPGGTTLVVLRGDMVHKNFWAIDLATGRERHLTAFGDDFAVGDFDVSPDGRELIFDREQDASDVVLIER
jgi:dipeptidyl aminopeptidase/acylaminoacyl peptidase